MLKEIPQTGTHAKYNNIFNKLTVTSSDPQEQFHADKL